MILEIRSSSRNRYKKRNKIKAETAARFPNQGSRRLNYHHSAQLCRTAASLREAATLSQDSALDPLPPPHKGIPKMKLAA